MRVQERQNESQRPQLKVLLVEDHPDILIMMTEMIRHLGHAVVAAATVAQAVAAAREERFDLLVSDYSLPDGTGIDVLRELRATQAPGGILVTAYGKMFASEAASAGFARYLQKPVELAELDSAIHEAWQAEPE